MLRLGERWKTFKRVYQKEIWQPGQLRKFSPQACLYAALRVISISWTAFNETKALSRAAALSFSSLLGLGPLVAITVLIAGFTLDQKDPTLAATKPTHCARPSHGFWGAVVAPEVSFEPI